MWELLEGFFYYLKSKGKRLPTMISLILIALVLIFYFLIPSRPPLSIEPVITVPLLDKEEPLEPKPLKTPLGALIDSDKKSHTSHTSYTDSVPSNEPELVALLDQYFRRDGLDPSLGFKIYAQINKDLNEHPSALYDMADSIKKVMGEEASQEELEDVKNVTLKAFTDSFELYLSKNNLDSNGQQ